MRPVETCGAVVLWMCRSSASLQHTQVFPPLRAGCYVVGQMVCHVITLQHQWDPVWMQLGLPTERQP